MTRRRKRDLLTYQVLDQGRVIDALRRRLDGLEQQFEQARTLAQLYERCGEIVRRVRPILEVMAQERWHLPVVPAPTQRPTTKKRAKRPELARPGSVSANRPARQRKR